MKTMNRRVLLGLATAAFVVPVAAFGVSQTVERSEPRPDITRPASATSPLDVLVQQMQQAAAPVATQAVAEDPYNGPVTVRDDSFDFRTGSYTPCAGLRGETPLPVADNDTVDKFTFIPGHGGSRIQIISPPTHGVLSSRVHDEAKGSSILHYLDTGVAFHGLSYSVNADEAGKSVTDQFTYKVLYGGTPDGGYGPAYSGSTASVTTGTVRIQTRPLASCPN